MILQSFCDCTLRDESGTRLIGPGELVTLPTETALKVMIDAPEHFKIIKPTPLLGGVAVCWALSDGRMHGPGIVQEVEGNSPNRRIAVVSDTGILWIDERNVIDINPWPAIDAKLEESVDHVIAYGEEAPKVLEVREWIYTHFDEDRSNA